MTPVFSTINFVHQSVNHISIPSKITVWYSPVCGLKTCYSCTRFHECLCTHIEYDRVDMPHYYVCRGIDMILKVGDLVASSPGRFFSNSPPHELKSGLGTRLGA